MVARALASLSLLLLIAAAPAPLPVEKKAQNLLAEWKPRFDAEKFNYVAAGPFVIAGNGSKERIARYRDQTILAAAQALHAMYFEKEPAEPVLILLFESAEPYQRLAKKWFGDEDVPHFGFFRRSQNVMLMNVGTGTGTLVHELVHALIAPDFPRVPDWFNEGWPASTSSARSAGLPLDHRPANWRLPALKAAIKKDELRPLRELIEDDELLRPAARRHELRAGALPADVPAGEETAGRLLRPLPRQRERRPHRPQDPPSRRRAGRDGRRSKRRGGRG
jgi:hypothetical protein